MKHARLPGPSRGFTIIELMIAAVIAAVLLAVAYPSYQNSIRKSRRVDAFTALSGIQQLQERRRSTLPSYADLPGLGLGATTRGGYYTLSLSSVAAAGYVAAATAVERTSQDADGSCRVLAVQMDGGNPRYGAGTTLASIDWAAANVDPQRCWAR
jgi:type IV pilus assembly protein PilE